MYAAPGAAKTDCHSAVSALVAAGKSFEEAAMHKNPYDRRHDRGQDQRTELVAKGDDLALPGIEVGLRRHCRSGKNGGILQEIGHDAERLKRKQHRISDQ